MTEVKSGGVSVDRSLILDPSSFIIDYREHDVPYLTRVSIDNHIYIGSWYNVTPELGTSACTVDWLKDMLELCEPGVLAYDIGKTFFLFFLFLLFFSNFFFFFFRV